MWPLTSSSRSSGMRWSAIGTILSVEMEVGVGRDLEGRRRGRRHGATPELRKNWDLFLLIAPSNVNARADAAATLRAIDLSVPALSRGVEDGTRHREGRLRPRRGRNAPGSRITEEKIAAFVATMRENILSRDTAFRRAYLRAVIDKVEANDAEIRIHGRRTSHINANDRAVFQSTVLSLLADCE